jgi:transcription elongation factor Elf1
MTNEEYVACAGQACPFCGSSDIEACKLDSEGREAWQEVKCNACDARWYDIFILNRYEQR